MRPRLGWILDRAGEDVIEVACSHNSLGPSRCLRVDLGPEESARLIASLDRKHELPVPHKVSFRCGGDVVLGSLAYAVGGEQPKAQASGWWLRFYNLQDVLPPRAVRRILTTLYVAGYRSLDEIRNAPDVELEAVERMAARSVESLRDFLDKNTADAAGWREFRRVRGEWEKEVGRRFRSLA